MKQMRTMNILDLQRVQAYENGEPIVDLQTYCSDILCDYRSHHSKFGKILVRQTVAEKLTKVQRHLKKFHPSMQLIVVEGYRHPFQQEQYYLHHFLIRSKSYPESDASMLQELTHQWVALPSVAGHPTGGAIDLTIACDGQEMNMGGKIADFTNPENLKTDSPDISNEELRNRRLLHDLMADENFAPFHGEWWHFSYGDREWAAFYQSSSTLYSPLFLH